MDNNSVRALNVNDVFSAKIRASKVNGGWQPPQMIFSFVKEISIDPETQEPQVLVYDLFLPLQQREDINQVTNSGIGPRLGIPVTFQKYDPEKGGSLFKRATTWDTVANKYTDVPVGAQFTRIEGGSRVEADFSTADRVEMKLVADFGQVKSEIKTRVGQVRDATADGGWRASTPWKSQFKRWVNYNGVPVEATVTHQTVKLLSTAPILLDRAPRTVEPAVPTADIGETL